MKMKRKVLALILSASLITCMFGSTSIFAATETEFAISNPYGTVDWAKYGQYKANFHTHSVEQGGSDQPAEMIEDYYAEGYDILALTEHDLTSTTWDRTDRPNDIEYLTSGRLAEIKAGADRNSRGMIGIPYSTEQSVSDHLNTFWANYTNVSGATLESKIAKAESLGGISHINHPGKYTGGVSTADGGADGAAASSDPDTVAYYTNLFEKYSSCVGMEIINKKDYDSYSDRILWDNILKQTMPNRPVWGFSNDDSHSVSATGFSFNMLLLPENNLGNVRQAMEKGIFYAVARVAKRELGSSFIGSGPTPAITNIAVNETEDSITITGTNYNKVEWVADGKVIATGTSIDLDNYADLISTYVRAQLKGTGGISFTQPFGIREGVTATPEVTTGDDTVTTPGVPTSDDTVTTPEVPTSGGTVTIPVAQSGDDTVYNIAVPIKSAWDDMEERSNGSLDNDSSDLEITKESSSKNQQVGLRFAGLNIPKGAKITKAYIQFSVDEPSKNTDPFNVKIFAENTANSAPYKNVNFAVSSRTKTAAYVSWSGIPSWKVTHEAGPAQQTPNLASLLQKIVDKNYWAEGNAINLILSGTGTRTAESFEGAGSDLAQVPTLYLWYTVE